jgi:hypothetical protein
MGALGSILSGSIQACMPRVRNGYARWTCGTCSLVTVTRSRATCGVGRGRPGSALPATACSPAAHAASATGTDPTCVSRQPCIEVGSGNDHLGALWAPRFGVVWEPLSKSGVETTVWARFGLPGSAWFGGPSRSREWKRPSGRALGSPVGRWGRGDRWVSQGRRRTGRRQSRWSRRSSWASSAPGRPEHPPRGCPGRYDRSPVPVGG